MATDHHAAEVVQLRQEVAQGWCRCQDEDVGSQVSTQPQLIYGDEGGQEVYGSKYSMGAVGSGSNSSGRAPQVEEGNVVPCKVQIEEATVDTSTSTECQGHCPLDLRSCNNH